MKNEKISANPTEEQKLMLAEQNKLLIDFKPINK